MEGIEYVYTWRALIDACPKCQSLDGKIWRGQDIFDHTLTDSYWGDVWNLDADQSLAHPNCRCHLEVHTEIDSMKVRQVENVYENLRRATATNGGMPIPSNVRELREEVRKLEKELDKAERKGEQTAQRLRTSYDVMMALVSLSTRMGLPEDVRGQIRQLQTLIMVYRQLYASAQLFYAASGPIGWAMFGITAASTAVTIGNLKMVE